MSDNQDIYLSVIIPAYNEEQRIGETLHVVKEYLKDQPYKSEIIVVDDGSNDITTEVVKVVDVYQQEFSDQSPSHIMENLKNVGKGFSIARGFILARGKFVLFSDADLSTPIQEVEKLFDEIKNGYDVAVGSRRVAESVVEEKPFLRKVLSNGFAWCVGLLGVRGIKDTQCGFKLYTAEVARDVAMLQKIYGFGFDVEHLYIAQQLGYRICEVGVEWTHVEGSKINPLSDAAAMLLEILRIRLIHRDLSKQKKKFYRLDTNQYY